MKLLSQKRQPRIVLSSEVAVGQSRGGGCAPRAPMAQLQLWPLRWPGWRLWGQLLGKVLLHVQPFSIKNSTEFFRFCWQQLDKLNPVTASGKSRASSQPLLPLRQGKLHFSSHSFSFLSTSHAVMRGTGRAGARTGSQAGSISISPRCGFPAGAPQCWSSICLC